MKKNLNLIVTIILLAVFILMTVVIINFDVKPIGPNGSEVGFASFNDEIRDSIGSSDFAYDISKYLGDIPLLLAGVPVLIGFLQLIKRKKLTAVDKDIIILGAAYVLFAISYVVFDKLVINYRPVLESDGSLEASYPSTHAMIAVALLGYEIVYFGRKIKNKTANIVLKVVAFFIMSAIIIGRLFSGVHWATDIIAGVIFGAFLVSFYKTLLDLFCKDDAE